MVLLVEEANQVIEELRDQIEEELERGHPYATVDIKEIKRKISHNPSQCQVAINFIIRDLREDYAVRRDNTWLIVEAE